MLYHRVVHPHVDRPELLLDLGGGGFDTRSVGHIDGQHQSDPAQLFDFAPCRFDSVASTGEQPDLRTFARERPHRSATHACGGAGHDDDAFFWKGAVHGETESNIIALTCLPGHGAKRGLRDGRISESPAARIRTSLCLLYYTATTRLPASNPERSIGDMPPTGSVPVGDLTSRDDNYTTCQLAEPHRGGCRLEFYRPLQCVVGTLFDPP